MAAALPFPTRTDAGRALAVLLPEFVTAKGTIVLALVRGGVVVGAALAQALRLPLYPYVVRKLGHPANPEFALGAIAEGGETFLDERTMRVSGVTWSDLE